MEAKGCFTKILRVAIVACLLAALILATAHAASLTEIHGFTNQYYPDAGLVQAGDGSLFGTTLAGGAYGLGTVFKLATNGDVTFLYSFDGTNGAGPRTALLVGLDGALYGTTWGNATGFGPAIGATVFRLATNGVLTTLVSFSPTNFVLPSELVQTPDGTFYGTSEQSYGSVFSITGGSNFAAVLSFDSTNGAYPMAGLTLGNDGNLYGTTDGGGQFEDGTLFRMTPAGELTTLVNFDGTNGAYPFGELTKASDGSLYGLTYEGGSKGGGTIFRFTTGGAFTTVFDFNPRTISLPVGQGKLAVDNSGNVYGMVNHQSNAFEVATNGTFRALATFNGANGSTPVGDLIMGADSNFYGVTSYGGLSGAGTVFRLTPGGQLNTLFSFDNADGSSPTALVQGTDGYLYGTTASGGTGGGLGTIFKVTPGGDFTQLVAFDGTNGANPTGPLVEDDKGGLYGFQYAGVGNGATGFVRANDSVVDAPGVFSLARNGILTNYEFNPGDSLRESALLLGFNGVLYGAGDANFAKVFFLQPGGALSDLVAITNTNIDWPRSLIQGGDGALYGLAYASNGPAYSVFKATTDGLATTLASFPLTNSTGFPFCLLPGMDRNLYGMTISPISPTNGGGGYGGGRGGSGVGPEDYTFFRMTPDGTIYALATLTSNADNFDSATFVAAADGSFYSLTPNGVFFQITTNGAFNQLNAPCAGTAGSLTSSGAVLIEGSDGDFYGTVSAAGIHGGGYVFRLTLRPTVQAGLATNGAVNFTWDAIPNLQYQLQSSASLGSPVWNSVGSPVSTTNFIATAADTPGSSSRYYRVVQLP